LAIKYTKWPQNIPNDHKIYQHFLFYIRPSKIYPNWDFWFENRPSGNPGRAQRMKMGHYDFWEGIPTADRQYLDVQIADNKK
jgi:hypothetical protein